MSDSNRPRQSNVELRDGFTQVCVWPGCLVEGDVKGFLKFLRDELGVRAQYLEEMDTGPDRDGDGGPVRDTGGRNDVFFAVHDDDLSGGFAVQRLAIGIRWIEDVLAEGNYSSPIYPERVFGYRSWSTNA